MQKAASTIGTIVAPHHNTDFIVLGLAIFFGGIVGVLLTFTSRRHQNFAKHQRGYFARRASGRPFADSLPAVRQIPDGAIAFMTSLGLAAFVGLTGLHAGPIFLSALQEAGFGLLLGGIVVTLAPQIVGLAFGHFALRMNPILLLGALTGAQTVTAAMAAVQERSGSPVAVLGYTPAYPIANILLTTWGTIMVAVIAS